MASEGFTRAAAVRPGVSATGESVARRRSTHAVLSLIVPMYNEQEAIERFFEVIEDVLAAIPIRYEVVCVDDGSHDGTLAQLMRKRQQDDRVKYISFSRNFGKEAAITAGLDHATGDAAIVMDVDLQDPPELIRSFVEMWRGGYDVVYGARRARDTDTWLKRHTAAWFYSLINRMAGVRIPKNAGDYRLMDRRVIDALLLARERIRFMKGLFAWVGFRQIGVEYDRPHRSAGKSKFNFWRLWNFALDGVTGFSTVPLRIASYLGIVIASTSTLYGTYMVFDTVVNGVDVPGYASLMVAICVLGGVQMVVLGVIGEYLGRIYEESKRRPLYLIESSAGLEAQTAEPDATSASAMDRSSGI
jgi:polyisoprenyl-phosphate glycosyltransferase